MTTWYGYKRKMEALRKYGKDSNSTVSQLLVVQLKSLIESLGDLDLRVLSSRIESIIIDGSKGVSPEMNKYRNDEVTNLANTLQRLLKEKGCDFNISSLMNWVVELCLGTSDPDFIGTPWIEYKLEEMGKTIHAFFSAPRNILAILDNINSGDTPFVIEKIVVSVPSNGTILTKQYLIKNTAKKISLDLKISADFLIEEELQCYLEGKQYKNPRYTVSLEGLHFTVQSEAFYPPCYSVQDERPVKNSFVTSWSTGGFETVNDFFNLPSQYAYMERAYR